MLAADVTRTVPLVGADYRFHSRAPAGAEPLLRGLFHTEQLRPGLVLHRTQVSDLHDLRSSVTLDPALKLVMVIEGSSDVTLGHQRLNLGPDTKDGVTAALVSVREPTLFTRHWQRGRHEAKVSVTMKPDWFGADGVADDPALDALQRFCREHLARRDWRPTPRALTLARQIVHAPRMAPWLRRLYLESRCIELVGEALAGLVGHDPQAADTLSPRDKRRLQDLLQRIDAGQLDGLDHTALAASCGMSASTLQRKFRRWTGRSLFDHLRTRRLEAARHAIEHQGWTVADAAQLAGYQHPANFATAFRRQFGSSPGKARRR